MATSSDGAEVRLGADTSAATEGMSSAATSIKGHLEDIKSSLAGFKDKNDETTKAIVASNKKASDSFLGLSEAVRVRFGSINSAFEQFRTKLAGVAEGFAALTIEHKVMESLLGLEDSVRSLEIALGLGAGAATQMSVALKLAGTDATGYIDMLMRVQMNMRTQIAEFDRLGVTIRDSNGNFLDAQTVLENVYKRMQDFKAGTDQNLMALTLVGRSARDFANEMQRLGAVQATATQMVHDFGIEMGYDEQAKLEAYRVQVNGLKVALEEVADRIGEAILPSMERMTSSLVKLGPDLAELATQAGEAFTEITNGVARAFGASSVNWVTFFSNEIKLLSLALALLRTGFLQVIDAVGGFARAMVAAAAETHNAESALLRFDFSGAIAAVKAGNAQLLAITKSTLSDMRAEYAGYVKDRDEILFGAPKAAAEGTAANAGLPKSGTLGFTPKPTKGAGGDDRLAAWKDQLTQMQEAEGYFQEMSKTAEAEFWQAKLALVQGYGKQDVKLRQELDRLIFTAHKAAAKEQLADDLATIQREIEGAKNNKEQQLALAKQREAEIASTYGTESKEYQKALEEETKLREQWAKKEEALVKDASKFKLELAKLEVAGEQETLNQQVALRQVSAQQRLAIEQQLENQLYSLKLKELEDDLATMHQGTLEYQKMTEQIEALEIQHQQKLTQIQNAAEQERKANMLQATADTQNAFASLFDSIATGTKSVKNAFLDFAKSIEDSLAKIASNQIAKQLFGPGTSGNNFLEGMFSKIFGGAPASGTGAGATGAAGSGGGGLLSAITGSFSSANGLLGGLFGDSNAATIASNLSTTSGSASSSGGLLGALFGTGTAASPITSLASSATDATGTASTTASMTALSTVVTTTTTSLTLLDTITDTLQAAFTALQAAAQSAAAAMQSMSASGGGGLGLGSLFGVPAFAAGTPYVPQDMLAIVHQGEAIIPASVNQGGNFGMVNHNHFTINGPTDARTQSQIAAATARGLNIAQRRYM